MIASLKGILTEKNPVDVIVEVNGVGYRVNLSALTCAALPPVGENVFLRVRTVVREDAFDLFGFLSRSEEELFLLLTSVSHVGPKLALNVMSGLATDELVAAIGKSDVVRLTKIHGVGRKTAERLVLELKDKMKGLAMESSSASAAPSKGASMMNDLISALVNLGYREPQAEAAAKTATERVGDSAAFESVFRESLKVLRS